MVLRRRPGPPSPESGVGSVYSCSYFEIFLAVDRLTQRTERVADLVAEFLRLFPRRKMAAFWKFIVVDEMRKRIFCPGLRNLIDLIRERAHGHRDGNVLYIEEGQLVFPIKARGRNGCTRQ